MVGVAAKFLFLLIVWIVFVSLLFSYSVYFCKYVFTRVIKRGPVEVASVTTQGSSDKNGASFLLGRLEEVTRPLELSGLYELNVPTLANRFGSADVIELPKDTTLTVQNVNLVPVIKYLLSYFPADRDVVTVTPGTASPKDSLLIEWAPRRGKTLYWLVRLPPSDGIKDASAEQDKVNSILIDRAAYTLLYHMYYDPDTPLEWRKNAALREKFPNARALEAYYVGRQHLRSYLGTLDPTELDKAEAEFRLLQEQMPSFVDGLMLLGATLSEERKEREAIGIYQRVVAAIGTPDANDFAAKNALFQARLFEAVALRKLYRWQELHQAIAKLDALKDEVDTAIGAATNTKALSDLQKIKASVLAERAASIPYYLVLLYPGNLVEALTDARVPASLRLTPGEQEYLKRVMKAAADSPDDAAARGERDKMLRRQKALLFEKDKMALSDARAFLTSIAPPDRESWPAEFNRITSTLDTAAGYAIYRNAEAQYVPGPDDDAKAIQDSDTKFRKDCDDALQLLRKADAAHPNDYIVLEDMGLIYGNPRFDERGVDIETARALFDRAIKLKPRDYYGYQQLATLAVRQAMLWGVDATDAKTIDDALTRGNTARELRPGEPRTSLCCRSSIR